MARFHKTIKLWELEGLTYQQWMANYREFGAQMGSNPARGQLMRVGVFDKNGGSGVGLNITVRMTFRAILMQIEQQDYQ